MGIAADGYAVLPPEGVTADNVDDLFDEEGGDLNEFRISGIPTGLACPISRHYESEIVAAKMPDGSWVSWVYWTGGGKHGNPEEIGWIEDAFEVDCVEEQKMMTVQTFSVPA